MTEENKQTFWYFDPVTAEAKRVEAVQQGVPQISGDMWYIPSEQITVWVDYQIFETPSQMLKYARPFVQRRITELNQRLDELDRLEEEWC